jgi:ubiquinone/menaquinone biosynthesis C-methylase UbiE
MSIAASTVGPADLASSSHEYASRFAGEVGQYFLDVQKQAVLKAISKLTALTNVLEVGGGHCQLTEFYLNMGLKVTIQASTAASLQRAKDLGFENKTTFDVSPLTLLSFNDNSFDLVSAIRLMAHVEDWKELLKQMFRVSKQGIVFDFANINTLNVLTPLLFKG